MAKAGIKRITDGGSASVEGRTNPFVEGVLGEAEVIPDKLVISGRGRGGTMPVRNKKVAKTEELPPLEIQGSHGEPFGEPILPAAVKVEEPVSASTDLKFEDESMSMVQIHNLDLTPKPPVCPVIPLAEKPILVPEVPNLQIARMQTIRLGNNPVDIPLNWGSRFEPSLCRIFLHRVSVTSNPSGHLSAPVFVDGKPTSIKFRITRDNPSEPLPKGSIYLGSYSDVHVGPAMQALHVFLLP